MTHMTYNSTTYDILTVSDIVASLVTSNSVIRVSTMLMWCLFHSNSTGHTASNILWYPIPCSRSPGYVTHIRLQSAQPYQRRFGMYHCHNFCRASTEIPPVEFARNVVFVGHQSDSPK